MGKESRKQKNKSRERRREEREDGENNIISKKERKREEKEATISKMDGEMWKINDTKIFKILRILFFMKYCIYYRHICWPALADF